MTVTFLKFSLLLNWDSILVEGNALVGVINQAFEKYGRHNNHKDSEIRIVNTSQFWGVISNFFGDTFELSCLQRLMRVPWRARRSNQSILKEINSEYSLERLMLKLKLQYFDDLMQRAYSLEKDPDTGKDWGQEKKGTTEVKMAEWHH